MEPSIEKKLTELFLSNAELLDEGQSPLLTRPRRAALEALNLLGIPPKGPGNGDRYHYTDLRGVFGEEWEHYFTPSHPGVAPDDLPGQMHRMKFLNGFCCDARHLTRLADGVVFGSLAAAAREYPGLVGKYYNTLPHGHGSAVAELTAAFVQDGAFVYVPRGIRVELPFAVECGLYGDGEAVASFGRNLFIFEEGSQAQLVIDYCTLSGERSLACRTREIFVGSGARVEMVESCRLNERSSLVSASYARQQGDSVLHGVSVGLSAGLMRNEQTVLLEGRGAENHTNGLTIAGEQEHLDFATDIEHIASDCTSYQLFKGLAADGGTSVFSGRIYVAQDAQRTQAFQQNNNLLLSDDAHVYAKPQLEIYADNVKCSHGATVGQLDPEAIYYMRQRGIGLEDARRLQMYGFVLDVLGESRVQEMNELFDREIASKIEGL
ncbi:Fe-S cluster assembly protein SufD [Alistipes indistinctus]|uniref:Fe-S cluster assembly protein SufD n=1 Tax=Alistipes indistinctus TaxID=626932 RepID=UPI0015F1F04D|nr:Fe-S cluster assembly protein SufD [Alistipes indistinctus]BCG53187.1 Fe-S cluster assembly protein SufD [Alistipes indistinctus]